jgi:signal transduction histidine kinase
MDARVPPKETRQIRSLPLFRLPRSLAVRLALFYGVIFIVAAAALIGVVSYTTIASLTQQRDEAISNEVHELNQEMASEGGIAEVIHEIGERDSQPNKSQFIYALYDKGNHLVAGSRLLSVPRIRGWSDISSPTGDPDDQTHIVHFLSTILPGDYLLAVGEDTDRIDDVREFLFTAFIVSLGAISVLALAGGATLSWAFRRRLDGVAGVCREIMRGNLSLRVPARPLGDEIDLLAASVNSMLDRIVGLMDTLQQVSVDIAHDLRTPLTRLRQGLETTEQRAKTAQEYSRGLRNAMGQVDTILDTFAALLRIAEIEAGALRSTFAQVNLSAILQTVADAYAPPAEESGHRITSRIATNVFVTGDESLLTQLAANLVANGLRHTPTGTTISIGLENRAEHPTVTIADDGPGIPEADRERVFQRFVRLERSRTTPGNGLGLSLCAAIARLHDVRIELSDNHPGLRCELTF